MRLVDARALAEGRDIHQRLGVGNTVVTVVEAGLSHGHGCLALEAWGLAGQVRQRKIRRFQQQRALLGAKRGVQLQGIVGGRRMQPLLLEIGELGIELSNHVTQLVALALQHMVDLRLIPLIRQLERITGGQQYIVYRFFAAVAAVQKLARGALENLIDDHYSRLDALQAHRVQGQVNQIGTTPGQRDGFTFDGQRLDGLGGKTVKTGQISRRRGGCLDSAGHAVARPTGGELAFEAGAVDQRTDAAAGHGRRSRLAGLEALFAHLSRCEHGHRAGALMQGLRLIYVKTLAELDQVVDAALSDLHCRAALNLGQGLVLFGIDGDILQMCG
uniref:hypothetical protein n=1 Tax=Pseudomonas sp. CFBP 13710 TaxID=2775311 RepID=UPI001FD246B3|nr:hypothetical protein [Pseudomonas sp. CFBP 13710]